MDNLKIVATSEESKDFAFMTLTKDELIAELETRKRIIFIFLEQSLILILWNNIRGNEDPHDRD